MSQAMRYTLEEVSKRNGENGARTWLVINDLVYDVTEYKKKHPGGAELLDEYAGTDATSAFDDFGHSSDAKRIMKSYLIGELVDDDKMANRKNKNANSKATKTQKADTQRRRTFLAVLCGRCTS